MQDRSTRYQDILLTNWVKNHRLRNQKHHLRPPVTSNGHGRCVSGPEKPPPHSSKEREAHKHSERQNPRKSPAWPDQQGGVKVVILLDNSGTELFPAWARVQQCMQTFPRSFWEKPRVQGAMSIGGDICRSNFWWAHNMFNRYCSLTTQSHHFSVNQFATCNSQSGQTPRVMTLQCTGSRRY